MPEDPKEDAPAEGMIQAAPAALPEAQQHSDANPDNNTALQSSTGDPSDQPEQDSAAEAMAEDGWDFEDSALEGLGAASTQPPQAHEKAGHAPAVGSSSAISIQTKAEDAHGNGSVAGMSPPGGNWEGESELNFPLDDVPKEPKSSSQGAPFHMHPNFPLPLASCIPGDAFCNPSGSASLHVSMMSSTPEPTTRSSHWRASAGGELNLPEGGKLRKLVIPPASPLKPLGSGAQPDSSAALYEAMAHGDTVLPGVPTLCGPAWFNVGALSVCQWFSPGIALWCVCALEMSGYRQCRRLACAVTQAPKTLPSRVLCTNWLNIVGACNRIRSWQPYSGAWRRSLQCTSRRLMKTSP